MAKAASASNNQPVLLQHKIDKLDLTLNGELVERRAEIRATMLALIAGVHIFLLGKPGVAKSLLVNRTKQYIEGANAFDILMTRFTTPEEVFGPVSLKGLENDEFVRKIEGYLASARVAFVDEIFKANSSILNALLWAINERQYRHGDTLIDIPLSTLFCASNELPQGEELGALYDRLLFRFEVKEVRDQTNFIKMLNTRLDPNPTPILTWDEVRAAQAEAQAIVIPNDVHVAMAEIRRQLNAEGIYPTPRRFNESQKAIRAAAWLDEETEAGVEHLRPLKDIMWEHPDQQAKVDQIVLALSNPLDSKAAELLDEINKLEDKLDAVANQPNKRDTGLEVHHKLRRAKNDLDELAKKAGNRKRQSEVMAECKERLHALTSRTLIEVFNLSPDEIEDIVNKDNKDNK